MFDHVTAQGAVDPPSHELHPVVQDVQLNLEAHRSEQGSGLPGPDDEAGADKRQCQVSSGQIHLQVGLWYVRMISHDCGISSLTDTVA